VPLVVPRLTALPEEPLRTVLLLDEPLRTAPEVLLRTVPVEPLPATDLLADELETPDPERTAELDLRVTAEAELRDEEPARRLALDTPSLFVAVERLAEDLLALVVTPPIESPREKAFVEVRGVHWRFSQTP